MTDDADPVSGGDKEGDDGERVEGDDPCEDRRASPGDDHPQHGERSKQAKAAQDIRTGTCSHGIPL